MGERVWLLVLLVWSHTAYAHQKIYLREELEKQVTKAFLGGPYLKFELNDLKAIDCPHRSLWTTWRTTSGSLPSKCTFQEWNVLDREMIRGNPGLFCLLNRKNVFIFRQHFTLTNVSSVIIGF